MKKSFVFLAVLLPLSVAAAPSVMAAVPYDYSYIGNTFLDGGGVPLGCDNIGISFSTTQSLPVLFSEYGSNIPATMYNDFTMTCGPITLYSTPTQNIGLGTDYINGITPAGLPASWQLSLGNPFPGEGNPYPIYYMQSSTDNSLTAEDYLIYNPGGGDSYTAGTDFGNDEPPGTWTVTVVPEPATMLLLGLGALALLRRRCY